MYAGVQTSEDFVKSQEATNTKKQYNNCVQLLQAKIRCWVTRVHGFGGGGNGCEEGK